MKKAALLFGALMLLALPTVALASEKKIEGEATLRSTPFATGTYGAGVVSGEAKLVTDTTDDQTTIKVKVEGLTPGTTHIGHIHFGDCTRLFPGAIIHNLTPMTIDEEGVGVSKTVVGAPSLEGVESCEWWVAFHEGPANTSPQTPAVAVGPVMIEADD